jgi:hypothetical protein
MRRKSVAKEEMTAAAANFTFKDKSKFFELEAGEALKKGDGPALPTIVLPVGSVIYRADHAGAKQPSGEVPAFFTNRGSTRAYRRKAKGTLSSYVTTKEARLFDLNLNSLFDLRPYITKAKDREMFENYLMKVGGQWTVNPSYFTPRDLAEYQAKKVAFPNYLNRRMAEFICGLGFDGWVVKPYDFGKKTGLIQLSLALLAMGEDPLIEYTPEVMLCGWKEFASVKGLPEPNTPSGSPKGSPKGKGGAGTAAAGSKERRSRKARRH